ncbi:MAG: ATP-binding protein, partial [Saprospiraceae bacterium]|nr:ATP-binding protein [Saprospiraceae bacterium]
GYFFKAFRRLEKYVVEGLNWDSVPSDKNIMEIEKKIISGETQEDELVYRENDSIKRRRIYGSIHSIISAAPDDVQELYINESLITDKIAEERENSEREFDQLITDFENKKIDALTLEKILLRKAAQNKELEKQIKEFTKYTTSESTTIAIAEIQNYKKTISAQQKLITQLKIQLETVEKEVAAAEAIVNEAQAEIEKVREELIETRSQNLFLKSIKSQDLNEVLNLMHHIGISASTVQNYSKGVIFKIENDMQVGSAELKNVFSKINYEINKIYSISKFATKANFKINTKDTKLDVVEFIEQYLLNVVKPFLPSSLKLIVYKSPVPNFVLSFKPIELIIVIDNLINNSKKAKANEIEVSFESSEINSLEIHFADNGKGIDENIVDKIFDYGFTTTDGSGLGLSHVKEIIERIGGKIILNESFSPGAEFIIKLSKN